jgi:hypothetical protein
MQDHLFLGVNHVASRIGKCSSQDRLKFMCTVVRGREIWWENACHVEA